MMLWMVCVFVLYNGLMGVNWVRMLFECQVGMVDSLLLSCFDFVVVICVWNVKLVDLYVFVVLSEVQCVCSVVIVQDMFMCYFDIE